jgi:hypothetical protein
LNLSCLGVFSDTSIVCRPGTLELSPDETSFTKPEKDIKSGIYDGFSSYIKFDKHFDSVQASVDSLGEGLRERGQITGLLFRAGSGYPNLIGQWVEPGESYSLAADEEILELKFTTRHHFNILSSRCDILSQNNGLTLVTSRRSLSWGQGCEVLDYAGERKLVNTIHSLQNGISQLKRIFKASVTWNFNSMYDEIKPCYE